MVLIAATALIVAGVLASPGAELERLRLAGDADPAEVASVLEVGVAELSTDGTPGLSATEAYTVAEWYRAAAQLNPDTTAGYEAEALDRFRALRLDYRGRAAGWLGYVGESRVHRQAGRLDEALAVLDAVLETEDGVVPEAVRQLAEREALEVLLFQDPAAALEGADALGDDGAWIAARAHAALGDAAAAAAAARTAAESQQAARLDTLELLIDVDRATDEEFVEWAWLLTHLGREAEALAALEERSPPGGAALHGNLLINAGRPLEAAEQWQQALEASGSPDTADDLRWSVALALSAAAATDAALEPRAAAAWGAVIGATDDEQRLAYALGAWAELVGPDDVLAVFAEERDTVATHPRLRYRQLTAQLETGTTPAATIRDELATLENETDDDALRAAVVLTRARLSRDKPRTALSLLDEHAALLQADADTAAAADRLRVALWIDAGLLDPAADAVEYNPDVSPDTLLALADALADRYAESEDPATRAAVTRLVGRAVVGRPDDADTVTRGGDALVRAEAWAEAARLLRNLDTEPARLLLAMANLRTGETEAALALLESTPGAQAALLLAQWQLEQGQLADAIDAARRCRAAATAGSAPWWDATCVLAAAQLESNEPDAAAQLLRVSKVLHPVGARADLRRRVEALERKLSP